MLNRCRWLLLFVWGWLGLCGMAPAQGSASGAAVPARNWVSVPRITGRLTAADLGLVINTADPYSVAVGEYYAQRRGIAPAHVLRVDLPVKAALTVAEFETLAAQVRDFMGPDVQALALAWTQPYAVECNAITAALSLGFSPEACSQTCAPTRPSRYFNSPSKQPFTDLGVRPSMLLASRSVEAGKALIERGIASDQQLGKRGVPPAQVVLVNTADKARSVRAALFPPALLAGLPDPLLPLGAQLVLRDEAQGGLQMAALERVVMYLTGTVREAALPSIHWVPGALADHLTSFGGQLLNPQGQMSALDWLESGATASYGTVTEPCNHLQKFPHPQVLLMHYMQGATALEAYWRSVAWPTQGVFIGEPLAAPFGR